MKKGKIKFFNETKGYGFIQIDGGSEEIFVHVSGCKETIRKDDSVTFDIEEGKKGEIAVNVRVV